MMLAKAAVSVRRKASASVNLNQLQDRRVYQRSGTSVSLPLSGTYTGASAAIQARVITDPGSTEVVAWTTVAASPTGGTWSGSLSVPQGGWYKVQVRRGTTGAAKTGTTKFSVGDVWLFAGQSQQARMSTLVGSPPTPDSLTVYRNSNGMWQAPGEFSGTGGNGGIRFLNLMREYTGVPQAMAQTSVEGTAITDWEAADTAFVNAKNRLQAIGAVRGILWHQGGTGINDAALTKAEYKTRLAAIRTGFAGVGSFSLFGVFPLMHRTDTSNTDAATQATRQAHYEYIAENPSTVNLGWTPNVPMADDVHQTAAGSEVIAYAYAHSLLYSMGAVAQPSLGPRITGATRSGATVTLSVTHTGGTSLKVNNAGQPTGFQVISRGQAHSDGVALAISNIALGTDTITITLASNPGTAVDVYYQWGRFDNTNPVFDDSTALGRAVGNALQPLVTPILSPTETVSSGTLQALKFDNDTTNVRWVDSAAWTFPDADWTVAFWARIDDPTGTTSQYFFSNGGYGSLNTLNIIMYESGATPTTLPGTLEVNLKGATTGFMIQCPQNAAFLDTGWRLWIVERVKATDTLNIYWANPGGTRNFLHSASVAGLGSIDSGTGPALGTRSPPTAGNLRWLAGAMYDAFKFNGLLTSAEMNLLAAGRDINTDLGKTTSIHQKLNSLTTPATDAGGAAITAALNGSFTLTNGPVFAPDLTAVRFNAVDTKYTMADSPSFDMPNADWTFGFILATQDNRGTAAQYVFSNGGYQAAMSFNVLIWEASSGANANTLSVPMKGSGATNIEIFGAPNPSLFTDGVFRLWTIERVKATETLNVYYTPVNGARVLYSSGSVAALGNINPPGGVSGIPTIGTRAVTPTGRWYVGDIYSMFQVNSLLTQSQTESIAAGTDLITGLGLSPTWYHKLTSDASTITDLSGNGNTATKAGTASVVTGPNFFPDTWDYLKTPFRRDDPWNRQIPIDAAYSTIGAGWAGLDWGLQTWQSPDGYSIAFYQATNSDPVFNVRFFDTWWDVNGDTGQGARGWLRQGNTLTVENQIISDSATSFPFDMNPYSTTVADAAKSQIKPTAGLYLPFANPTTLPFTVRVPSGALPAPGLDGHMVIIQPDGRIFEAYGAIKVTQAQNAIVCTRYMMINPKLRGDGWSNGLTASMCSVVAGVLRNHEIDYASGSSLIGIPHAMKIAVPGDYLSTSTPVSPAYTMDRDALTHSPAYNGPNALPMGSRLALPWSVNLNSRNWQSDVGKAIATAAQKHGFIITDRGGTGLTIFNERGPSQARLTAWDFGIWDDVNFVIDNLQRVTSTV